MNALEAQTSESPYLTEALQLGCGFYEVANYIRQQYKANGQLQNEVDSLLVQLARERRRLAEAPQNDFLVDLERLCVEIQQAEKRILLYENEIARRREACSEQAYINAQNESVARLLDYRGHMLQTAEYQNERIALDIAAEQAAVDDLQQRYIEAKSLRG